MIYYAFIDNPDTKNIRNDILENPDKFLKEKMTGSNYSFGMDNLTNHGYFKYMGYLYSFKNTLKKYLYKQHGQWSEIYALNKTNARKLIYGRIDSIIEIDN